MTHLTVQEQQDYRAQWIARQQFIAMFQDLCDVFQQVTGCTRDDLFQKFFAGGHQHQYDPEWPKVTTARKVQQTGYGTRAATKARKEPPESLMNDEELRAVILRLDICTKMLRQHGKCIVEQAKQIHQKVGDLVRVRVFQERGFYPKGFPVARWVITAKDVIGDPPHITNTQQGRLLS